MSDNIQQIEYWNGPTGHKWAVLQEKIDRAMAAIASSALTFAKAGPGMRVVDIGCGCGTTSLALADAAGPKGSVLGVDISAPMLEVARARAGTAANLDFVEADASSRCFAPEHDLAFSRFGVMFFADPVRAFANIRGGLKPDGRLAFVCWRSLPENDWAVAPMAAASGLLPQQPETDPHAPGPFALADETRVKAILERAGFRDARTQALDSAMYMGADLNAATEMTLKIGPIARAIALAGDGQDALGDRLRPRVRDALAKYVAPGGVVPPAACWLVEARA